MYAKVETFFRLYNIYCIFVEKLNGMIIASQKRKENIAEYLLYMWQIEDLIRAYGLDIDTITNNLISKYELDDDTRKNVIDWYESLIDMMRREDVVKSGHLQINKNIILQLTDLNNTMLKDSRFTEYSAEFYKTLPFIVELRAKAADEAVGEIETCFTALYGLLLMKLQGKEISNETLNAMKQISHFLAVLSRYFKLDSENQLFKLEE